jgi:lariat debranching enzyme
MLHWDGKARLCDLMLMVGAGCGYPLCYLIGRFHGGWVAPNIYYLGAAGVVQVAGIRIGGLSGIYDSRDYHHGHHESPPFTESTMRSAYHIREYEVAQLLQLQPGQVDIFMSHDWPTGMAKHGAFSCLTDSHLIL